MSSSRLFAAFLLFLGILAACGDSKPKPAPSAEPAAKSASAPAKDANLPVKFVRNRRAERAQRTRGGDQLLWRQSAGIAVESEGLRRLYSSGSSTFVGFRAAGTAGDAPCVIDWVAHLMLGPGGQGGQLDRLSGQMAIAAGQPFSLSTAIPLERAQVDKIKSVNVSYWTICGDELGSPNIFQVKVEDVTGKRLGGDAKQPGVHHTEFSLRGDFDALRCYFELVAEDVDRDGFVLNRDVSAYSLAAHASARPLVRRTDFESGNEADYVALIASKRGYIRHFECMDKPLATGPKLEGIAVDNLSLERFQAPAESVQSLSRASFRRRGRFVNKMGKDCSFSVRYQILDKAGVPLSLTTPLGEAVHLKRGARIDHTSSDYRVSVSLAQVEEIDKLVVVSAAPIEKCTRFDAARALTPAKPQPAQAKPAPAKPSPAARPTPPAR
jgi:hypothetical protein